MQFSLAKQGLSGYVVIIDPKESIIAEKLEIKLPGKYALKVR